MAAFTAISSNVPAQLRFIVIPVEFCETYSRMVATI